MLAVFTLITSSFTPNIDSSSSDFVRESRTLTLMQAEAVGQHPNDNWHNYWLDVYMYHYNDCLDRIGQ
jgi:hypothetical protein